MKKVPIKKWLIPAICTVVVVAVAAVAVLLLQPKGGVAIVKNWKPQRASSDVEPYARRAIDIIDSYLDFEISGSEAKAAFDEVRCRMNELNILSGGKQYNLADDVIENRVASLYLDAEDLSDSSYREHRDLLMFQIGEPVSGRTYPARQTHYDEEDQLCEAYFDEYLTLANRYSHNTFDDMVLVSVDFDYMNGTTIKDMRKALEHAWSQLEGQPGKNCSVIASYQKYGQDVFSVYISKFEENTAFLVQSAIDFHKVDVENKESLERNVTSLEFQSFHLLKEELEKMSAAFDP